MVTNKVLVDKLYEHLRPFTIDASTGYAVKRIDGKLHKVHRLVMSAVRGEIVDHINGNKLDNRRTNLRLVSKSQNNRNKPSKGYTKTPSGLLQVKTTYQGKTYYIGSYFTESDADIAFRAVTKFIFDITGIDVTVSSKPETIEIGGKKYQVSDELKDALKGLKEL